MDNQDTEKMLLPQVNDSIEPKVVSGGDVAETDRYRKWGRERLLGRLRNDDGREGKVV